jgi:hypothetical protein
MANQNNPNQRGSQSGTGGMQNQERDRMQDKNRQGGQGSQQGNQGSQQGGYGSGSQSGNTDNTL